MKALRQEKTKQRFKMQSNFLFQNVLLLSRDR